MLPNAGAFENLKVTSLWETGCERQSFRCYIAVLSISGGRATASARFWGAPSNEKPWNGTARREKILSQAFVRCRAVVVGYSMLTFSHCSDPCCHTHK